MSRMCNPKRLLEFIALPQGFMAALLALVMARAGVFPDSSLAAVLALQVGLNIAVVVYYMRHKDQETVGVRVLYAILGGLLVLFSCGGYMMFRLFSSTTPLSPETLYLLCNAVSLIYLAAAIIVQQHPAGDNIRLAPLIICCFALPVAVYLLLTSSYVLGDVSIVAAIGLLCVFLFLLGKLAYLVYAKHRKPEPAGEEAAGYSDNYRAFLFVAAVLLPQAGLAVNRNLFWHNVLGDFSSVWFYIIAAVNGLLLLLDANRSKYGLPLFYLKSAGLTFIAYFTLVFIPYMPYAIVAVVFYGLGLLVFVPVVLFVTQAKQLRRHYAALRKNYSKRLLIAVAAAGLLSLPVALAVNFGIDRVNFNNAMAYTGVGTPQGREISLPRLARSVAQIENAAQSTRQTAGLTFMPGTPLITAAYRYIALDNRLFTEDAVLRLQQVFMPEAVVSRSEVMLSEEPEAGAGFYTRLFQGEAEYDPAAGVYTTWIDLEITPLRETRLNEYATRFTLPDGCFITDYYLYVGAEKKWGIMTDKRAALAAYESIIRTPQDPGIIYYENDHTIALRVFPFIGLETRRTGFQVMYSQDETLMIDGATVTLTAENAAQTPLAVGDMQFVPAAYKKTLPVLRREPVYCFLLDAGAGQDYARHADAASRYAQEREIDARYYAVSYQAEEVSDLAVGHAPVRTVGGFNAALAMREIFQTVPDGCFPVIVLVTDNVNRAVPMEDNRLTRAFPEADCYYRLNEDASLTPYRFSDSRRLEEVREPLLSEARSYNGMAVGAEGSELVTTGTGVTGYTGSRYADAFILQNNVSLADTDERQIAGIKEAMARRVLTRHTAFIVMETKEQEDMLLALQEQFLRGEAVQTPSVMMSEPGWGFLAAGVLVVVVCRAAARRKVARLGGKSARLRVSRRGWG